MIIINYCKPLTNASLERQSLHCVQRKFIHKSRTSNRGSQSWSSACNAVKYAMYSKSCTRQRFTVIHYSRYALRRLQCSEVVRYDAHDVQVGRECAHCSHVCSDSGIPCVAKNANFKKFHLLLHSSHTKI